ncbi:MAG: CpsD/CapB family tyrosine-protein kinase, partial [Ramlibacter sp.]|nr:CpsD/CapB family tyrosine-protein kinase [Ramlibacter sp.]
VGKTFVSANLATVMAQGGKKVLLIDADLRKGYVHELLNVELGQGLAEYLANPGSSAQIKQTSVAGLGFMSHGTSNKANPAELLSSPRLAELLQQASSQYDFVIVDSPPVLAVTDANIIGQLAGTTLMITRFEQTTVKDIEASLDRLRNNQIQVAGAVLNGIERSASNYHAYEAYASYGKTN